MRRILFILILALCRPAFADSTNGDAASSALLFREPSQPIKRRVDDLLGRLTLDEKVSLVRTDSPPIPRLGIAGFNWWSEALHGAAEPYSKAPATCFPQALGMAASWNPVLMRQVGDSISDELRARYNHNYQNGLSALDPNINILRDPRWGRALETYGEDPFLTGRIGVAFIRGLQGDDPKYMKIAATAKHYAVHSGPDPRRRHFNAIVSMRDLFETYLPAFRAMVQEGKVADVMSSYNEVNGVPCTANHFLLDNVLRGMWGFRGFVVSDDQAAADVCGSYHAAPSQMEGGALVMNNGCDMELGAAAFASLAQAVKAGLVTQQRLDEACGRNLRVRFELGEFDPPAMVPYSKIPYSVVGGEKSLHAALQMARESIVLLKNDGQILPLDENKIHTIAVIGPNADNPWTLISSYFWSTPTRLVTPLEAIRARLAGRAQVLYARGCDWQDAAGKSKATPSVASSPPPGGANASELDPAEEAVQAAGKSDAAILFMGLHNTSEMGGMEGEGVDRNGIALPAVQEALLKKLQATGKPVILVLMNGGPLTCVWAQQHTSGILEAWYPGQEGGTAVADALFGDFNPAGRLPCTVYRDEADIPAFDNYSMDGRSYRYFKGVPLYPFGFGLSYTAFSYGNLAFDKSQVVVNDVLQVAVDVKNTGARDGDEVVQVYVSKPGAVSFRPIRQLVGFSRVHIGAGQSSRVTIPVRIADWRYWDDKASRWQIEPGMYEVEAGASSSDIRLRGTVRVIAERD